MGLQNSISLKPFSRKNMNLKIVLIAIVFFADAARPKRSRFFKFHGHKASEKTDVTKSADAQADGISKRNRAIMLMIANVRSQERRVALMSAMSKSTEESAQKLRMVFSLRFLQQCILYDSYCMIHIVESLNLRLVFLIIAMS